MDNSDQPSSRTNSPRGAQTASIGNQDMMTFLFNSGDSANNSTGGTSQSGCLHDIQPSTIPDPLRFFSNEDEVFDSVSLDALLNSVHSASQHAEGDQQQVDASTTLGELSRAHAAAVQLHGGDGGQQQQQQQHGEANSYVGLNNALFRPSQPVSVSTGNVFASTPLMGMNYGMGNGGGLIIGMNGGASQQQQLQQQPQSLMMPQQQTLSNSILPHQVAHLPQSTTVTFQTPNYAQHQQLSQMNAVAATAWNSDPNLIHLKNPIPSAPASTSSISTKSNKRKKNSQNTSTSSSHPPISEDESDRKKRRYQRNLREQERSHQITGRINELRDLLAQAGMHFKPDRYSTLVGVVNYIKQLQNRTKTLDDEHRKLIETISGANRLANGSASTTVQSHGKVLGEASQSSSDSNTDEEFMIFLQGIDYKFIFKSCGVALAITSVDGRFVDCNEEFLRVTNYTREELLGEEKGNEGGCASSSNTSSKTGATSPTIGGLVTVYTTSTNPSEMTNGAAAAPAAVGSSSATKSSSLPGHQSNSPSRPPTEVHMRKKLHLSLFNLLGREDMENVYAAMSRMLKAPITDNNYVSTSLRDPSNSSSERASGKVSSANPSNISSNMPRSSSCDSMLGSTASSSGNEVSRDGISRYQIDHWSGKVKHTRRKDQLLQINISLVRTADGRPKFFNCAFYEIE